MEITLEKIELVKDRTGVSYKEAKEALEAADGSVVDAIIDIEESIDVKNKNKFAEQSAHIIEKVKEAIKKGNVAKIIVKKNDEVIMNLPVNVGIVGTVLAPWAAVAGVIAAFGTKCVIELIKEDGEIIDISEIATDTFDGVVEKGTVVVDEVKTKGAEVFENIKTKTSEAINKSSKKADEGCCACGSEEECDDSCTCGSSEEEK
jgi:Transcription factor homologous to NACalpha-BTF3